MITCRMRYICRFGEWRNRDQWDTNSKLIESRATCRERPGWITGQRGTQRFGIDECRIGCADEIPGTFRTASRLLTKWRKREIFALPRKDAIRSARSVLQCARRFGMVIEPAMLIVQNKYD